LAEEREQVIKSIYLARRRKYTISGTKTNLYYSYQLY